MFKLLIFLAKVFLAGIPFMLIIGVLSTIFVNIGRLFSGQKYIALLYSILFSIIFAYFYAFWGAYLKAVVVIYSEIYDWKWLIILLCFVSIVIWLKGINAQAQSSKTEMLGPQSALLKSGQEIYMESLSSISLAVSLVVLISFLIFLFTQNLHNKIFFGLPAILSSWFV